LLCSLTTFVGFGPMSALGLDFLMMGDWGGESTVPYYTPDEKNTASILGSIASSTAIMAVFGIGDNFYDEGVSNASDPRFQETFEDVFTASSLKNMPFYMIAGNHDHEQNVTAQVVYSNKSARWRYPNYWYSLHWQIPNTSPSRTIQIIMIDTVTMCGGQQDLEFCQRHNIPLSECKLEITGPSDSDSAQEEWDWLKQELEQSTADFLIVAGHYPVYSIAEHGPTPCLVEQLEPWLLEYNVTAYVSGHDHTFEYINVPGQYVNYIVTGGAHVCDSSIAHAADIPKDSLKFHGCQGGGFVRLNVQNTLSFTYYYGTGTKEIYVTPEFQPRTINPSERSSL